MNQSRKSCNKKCTRHQTQIGQQYMYEPQFDSETILRDRQLYKSTPHERKLRNGVRLHEDSPHEKIMSQFQFLTSRSHMIQSDVFFFPSTTPLHYILIYHTLHTSLSTNSDFVRLTIYCIVTLKYL